MSFDTKCIVLLLGVLVQEGVPPAAPVQTKQIADIHQEFTARTSEFTNPKSKSYFKSHPRYPAGDLNSALTQAKSQLIASFPVEAEPLRDYVQTHFPSRMEGHNDSDKVDMRECGPYITSANSMLKSLEQMNAYQVNLTIDSNQNQATFTLHSATGRSWSQITKGQLLLWRGEYKYDLARSGQKTITGSLDLVTQPGSLLVCTFVPEGAADAPMPCQLKVPDKTTQ